MLSNKFFAVLLFLAFLVCPLFPALAYRSPGAPAGFVNDFAGVLPVGDKDQLESKLASFEQETSNEISIAIVKSLDGDTVENFAVELFEEWKIGKAGKDNGVLLLAAIDDRRIKIEVGYGLEGALTDAQSSWIIKDIIKPAFQKENYYAGIDGAADKIIAAARGEFVPSENESQGAGDMGGLANIFYFAMFVLIWLGSVLARSKSWWAGGVVGAVIGIVIGAIKGFLFFGLIATALLVPFGLLLDFLVSRSYQKNKNAGSFPWWIGGGHGGGFGGFGGSGGGGFGGFGGGRSGGGGASGGW